jgi:hypothetical protein
MAQDSVPGPKEDLRPQIFINSEIQDLESNLKLLSECRTTGAVTTLANRRGWYLLREDRNNVWLETRTSGRLLRAIRLKKFAELSLSLPANDAVRLSNLPAALLEPIDMEMFVGSQRADGDPAAILTANVEVTLSFGGRDVTHTITDENVSRQRAKLFASPLIDQSKEYVVPKLTPTAAKPAVSPLVMTSICFGAYPSKRSRELDSVAGPFYLQLTKATEEAEKDRDKAMDAFINGVPDRFGKADLRSCVGRSVASLSPDQSRGLLASLVQGWQFNGFSSEKEARVFALQAKITSAEPKLQLMFGGSKRVLYSYEY